MIRGHRAQCPQVNSLTKNVHQHREVGEASWSKYQFIENTGNWRKHLKSYTSECSHHTSWRDFWKTNVSVSSTHKLWDRKGQPYISSLKIHYQFLQRLFLGLSHRCEPTGSWLFIHKLKETSQRHMSVHVDTELCPETCLRGAAGPQKKLGALTAVLPLPEGLETRRGPRTASSDPPPGEARSRALGPAGSQSGRLSSFQEPCGLGFSLLSYESFSTDPFRFSFSSFAVIFWLERLNVCYPVVPLLTLSPLFIFGFPPNHHFYLYLFMVYSDIISSISVI